VTLRDCWVTLRARWVTLRARWVTLRARWVTLRARWVTPPKTHTRPTLRERSVAPQTHQLTGCKRRQAHAKSALDGSQVGSCSDDRSIRVWDVSDLAEVSVTGGKTRAPAAVMYGHGGRLWDCTLVPEANMVITASEDCTCRVWTLAGAPLATLQGHRCAPLSLSRRLSSSTRIRDKRERKSKS
jgi:WD40 repeat protein